MLIQKLVCDFLQNSTKKLEDSPLIVDYEISDQKSGKISGLNEKKKLDDLKIEVKKIERFSNV